MFRTMAIALFALLIAGCTTAEDRSIDPRPQFDAQGNTNFDIHGNYIGCHGIGCSVDEPALFVQSSNYYVRESRIYDSDDNYAGCHGSGCLVDDPSLYEDNPNFDDDGEYVGCHGIGCLVDDPD